MGSLLAQVKSRAVQAQQHQDLPFEQVVELMRPERSLSHSPLFQVLFNWQNASESEGVLQLPGLAVESLSASEHTTARLDLSMTFLDAGEVIAGGIEYASALFDATTIERYIECWRTLLREMVTDTQRPVSALRLLPEAERQLVVETWNATDAPYPVDRLVHELFEAQAAKTPDAIALVQDEASLTYAELNAQANRLAHYLRSLGVQPDDRVGLCVERNPAMVVGLLAVLKAGGAYVPLDPGYPADRLAYMLEDSAPVAVLTQQSLQTLLAWPAGIPVLTLDADRTPWQDAPADDPVRGTLSSEHLAYVIYTSGSTGQPKGVMVEHRQLSSTLVAVGQALGFEASDCLPNIASPAFDISLLEQLMPLVNGGMTLLLQAHVSRHVDTLIERTKSATFFHAVPSLMETWLAELGGDAAVRYPNLRVLLVGGEPVSRRLVQKLHASFPAASVIELYGPTETAIVSTYHRADSGDGPAHCIGQHFAHKQTYLLDRMLRPVPIGVAGELYIGGVGVARGYLNRPELTAERFVRDPFSAAPEARMYRSGDLGRWLPDGTIEFLGRNDFQVKVRGFRIELGEIESRLVVQPGVREAVVLAREDVPGDKRLIAYYLAEAALSAQSLRMALQQALPDYMVPAAYVHLAQWPLTPSGKLDRSALPAPDGQAYTQRAYEPPQGEVETTLASIWCELLRLEQVGRHDDFFELGGHSLLAVQAVSRVRQQLSVEVPLTELFAASRLSDFAQRLRRMESSRRPAIERASDTERSALSFAQQRLWFLSQLDGVSAAYHMPAGLRLRGALDQSALRCALDRLVERHESLRTTFDEIDGEPVQKIRPAQGFALR
ncbi:non-ribosomal peptide synthetase, partial [Lysobacter sp. ESA13C]|uniref:non-ribosomal peptide synthetase n=1 Tax=Lysobacter sp. ESA13C TaxID=2862676 RepID=UPI001CBD4F38